MKKPIILLAAAVSAVSLMTQPAYASDAPTGAPTAPVVQNGSDTGAWILLALLALGAVGIIVRVVRHQSSSSKQDKQLEERFNQYAGEMARISSTLLAALIALMTFLLVVGVQNSVNGFTTELYTAIILLGLGLVLYALGHSAGMAAAGGRAKVPNSVSILRGLQQLVFVGSIAAVVWFAFSYAQLVIKPLTDQQSPDQSQQQPDPQSDPAEQPTDQPQPSQ